MNQITLEQMTQVVREFIARKNWDQLAQVARELQAKHPSSPEGFFAMGVVVKQHRDYHSAEKFFVHALTLNSERYDVAIELAQVYFSIQRYQDSLSLIEEYKSYIDNSAYYLLETAKLFHWLGLHENAWRFAKKADSVQPNNDVIKATVAEYGVLLGKVDEAKQIYEKLISKYPNYQKHHYDFSKLQKAQDHSHVHKMKHILETNGLAPEQNIYLYYALGKQLEDLEVWDEAFHYYEKAGSVILEKSNYDVAIDIEVMEKVISTCDEDWMLKPSFSLHENTGRTPIFIVGLPRTGSTLIERVLASHPDVESADETFYFPMALNNQVLGSYFGEISKKTVSGGIDINWKQLAENYCSLIDFKLSRSPYFIDKYPFNFIILGFIAKAFPSAKFVYLDRHPLDACFAMFKQSYFKFAYCLEDVGNYYIAHKRLKKHWEKLFGDRIVNVSYENFVSAQREETVKLLSSLGLSFSEQCMEFHLNPTASGTASTLQVREKVHRRSVGRWKNFARHLAPLERNLKAHNLL
ncbi:tetratricopeptide repeat-containing sulfotransferase family protein [Alteromonas gracilis]|uniref:tetratricopeptide repeat-containing sulfotransferase family protein n=1 Tax=Alteromonas gracilis TaxID=1479524 RepID=UPI002FDF5925